MTPETLALARDLALILLAVEAMVLLSPLVIIPLYIVRYLPRYTGPIRPNLRRIRRRTQQVEQRTRVILALAVQPFLWAAATAAGLRRGLGYLARRR
ncbi:MAG: hypothetical protein GTO63_36385 [Anaerolineae bacterium]|nr:hypothetical protein [Anaerolineae bacterium]NIO00233.1 hypothetical protein [Anaerolineae bacterium]NIQ83014.1 hypothetical protein [Anaerolineae bacterium]